MFGEEIVDTLSHKYRVQRATVHDALSQVLAGPVFQRATGARFGEITADGVMVFGLRGAGLLGAPRRSLTRLLSYELERKLSDAATAAEYTEWKLGDRTVAGMLAIVAAMGFIPDQAVGSAGVATEGAGFSEDFASRSIWFMPSWISSGQTVA